jgi:ABC-2 type transport system ATP-binding protein
MSHAIELEKVTKRFGNCLAVDDLDLVVPEGAIYGFIGPNGSGKTTTLRMILRILYPDSGRVTVLGYHQGTAVNDCVGYLPEERGLYKKMRVRELLRFFAQLKGMRRCSLEIDDWLERFDLARWANQKVETLSKGMAQKVQFIAAIVAKPRLLVLDEPFTGLDPVNTDVLRNAVQAAHQSGTTVIFSTHDMDVAERLCDTIFMIYRGKKVLDGTLAAIQAQFGEDTIRLRTTDADCALADLPGVIHVNDQRHYKELRIVRDADPRVILLELLRRTSVEHFELARPSLHDIFVRIAGPESQGNGTGDDLCQALEGPFRQIGPVAFSGSSGLEETPDA